MAEHFLSLVEHHTFFGFFDFHPNFSWPWQKEKKQTNKKSNFQITLLNDLFFSISSQLFMGWKQTNKKKLPKKKVPNVYAKGEKKKHQQFVFFSIFVQKPFGERGCWCSLRHFIATNVCFCSKAFLLLSKKEKFTCADRFFFSWVLGTRGLDKQIKYIFFRWSKRLLESEKKEG